MERGEYRPIYTVLPDSPEFQALSAEARLLLYTVKMSLGPAGIDVIYDDQLRERSGLQEIDSPRQELVAEGWLEVEGRVHWLRNGLRYEPTLKLTNENHRKFVERILAGLPRQQLVLRFAAYYDLKAPFELPPEPPSGRTSPKALEGHPKGIPNGIPDKMSESAGEATATTIPGGHPKGIRRASGMPSGITTPEPETTPTPLPTHPAAVEASKESDEAERGDGVDELVGRFPAAAAALNAMKHKGGRDATRSTLNTRFVYRHPAHDAMPDPSVADMPDFERRLQLVAEALDDMHVAGIDTFKPPTLAAFIRPLRDRPPLDSEAAGHSGASEAETHEHRRKRARVAADDEAERARLQAEGELAVQKAAKARQWLEAQPDDVQKAVALEMRAGVKRLGWRRDPGAAPAGIQAIAVVQAVERAKARILEEPDDELREHGEVA